MEIPEKSRLPLMECLRLRVQGIDFAGNEILGREGKGAKDRITTPAESLKAPLQSHLKKVKAIHERDLAEGSGRVQPQFAARSMDYGAIADVSMPIRITRHHKSFYGMEAAGTKGPAAARRGESTASYTGRKSKSPILCGSIYLLLGRSTPSILSDT
jgi:hypothetical protein